MIQNLLRKDPEAGLLDLGANIGVYTLSIAKMGRKVHKLLILLFAAQMQRIHLRGVERIYYNTMNRVLRQTIDTNLTGE